MAEEAWGEAADNFIVRGTPYNRAESSSCCWTRARRQVGDPTQCHAVAIDARAPKFDGGIVTRLDLRVARHRGQQHAQRFYDEGEDFWPKRYAIWGRLVAAAARPDRLFIIDSKVLGRFMPSVFPADRSRQRSRNWPASLSSTRPSSKDHRRDSTTAVGPARFDHTDPGRLPHRRADAAEDALGAADRYAAVLRLSAAAGHHLHVSRGAGQRARRMDARRLARGQHLRRRRNHGGQRLGKGYLPVSG